MNRSLTAFPLTSSSALWPPLPILVVAKLRLELPHKNAPVLKHRLVDDPRTGAGWPAGQLLLLLTLMGRSIISSGV